jgi:hypothetical protein
MSSCVTNIALAFSITEPKAKREAFAAMSQRAMR